MKAAQINRYGGVEVFEINTDVPKPTPEKDQILAEIYAASINPFDWKVREGYMKNMIPLAFPAILGGDFAGKVISVGEGVTEFHEGDEVYGQAPLGKGSFAEFTAAKVTNTAHKPSVTFEEAAALPLVGSSAIQALEEHIKLKSGQRILIHGGAGGIGHIAIQLAKTIGAHVATTVSTPDIDFAKEIGADQVIDYKKEKFEEILKDVDAVFDTVGGETTDRSLQVLKKGGVLVSMVNAPNQESAKAHGVDALLQMTQTNSTHLTRMR